MIIGEDNAFLNITEKPIHDKNNSGVVSSKTPLGWVVSGIDTVFNNNNSGIHHNINEEGDNLQPLIKSSIKSKEDESALKILEETTKYSDSRLETGLLKYLYIA